jgi:predicted nucleic acid-binding protein
VKLWDTSALLSLLLAQRATESLKEILSADPAVVLWWGTKVEAVSAVSRLSRGGHLEEGEVSRAVREIETLTAASFQVQPTEEVRAAACRLLRVHELRAADALQLAAALVWTEHSPAGAGFVCLDRRLRQAADREGFEVLPA